MLRASMSISDSRQGPDVLRARPNAFEIALKRIDNRRVGNEDGIVVLAGEPRPGEVARTGAQHRPIDGIGFQMHENALAFDPRDDVGLGEQRFDQPPACGSVLGELRSVQIEPDEDAAFGRLGQHLDDPRVGQNVRRHVDRQLSAANRPGVEVLKVLAGRIMDLGLRRLGLGSLLRASDPEHHQGHEGAEKYANRQGQLNRLNDYNFVVVSGCKCKASLGIKRKRFNQRAERYSIAPARAARSVTIVRGS
jgi:hypothetical protein